MADTVGGWLRDRPSAERSAERLIVGFSGGPDSLALLLALTRIAPALGIRPIAAHYDHSLDDGASGRAAAAAAIATRLGVEFFSRRRNEPLPRGRGVEAGARELRYRYLDALCDELSAEGIAVAHHRDDQVETILLRILGGTGLTGLAGIPARRGRLVRPLLTLPKSEIDRFVAESGITPVSDPTNRSLDARRNRIRLGVLPALRRKDPGIVEQLLRVGAAAARASAQIDAQIDTQIDTQIDAQIDAQSDAQIDAVLSTAAGASPPGREVPDRVRGLFTRDAGGGPWIGLRAGPVLDPGIAAGISPGIDLAWLRGLPTDLRPFVLARLHRQGGAVYPPGAAALGELERQLARPHAAIGVDCGDGWRWYSSAGRLGVERLANRGAPKTLVFAYTLRVPGVIEIPEIATSVRLRRERTKPWMFRGSPTRTALVLPLDAGDRIEIRNRRPGDRVRPLGCDYERRLKEIFIDAKVTVRQRPRVPLLVCGGKIAWVPGVTIEERFRVRDETKVWTATITPLDPS